MPPIGLRASVADCLRCQHTQTTHPHTHTPTPTHTHTHPHTRKAEPNSQITSMGLEMSGTVPLENESFPYLYAIMVTSLQEFQTWPPSSQSHRQPSTSATRHIFAAPVELPSHKRPKRLCISPVQHFVYWVSLAQLSGMDITGFDFARKELGIQGFQGSGVPGAGVQGYTLEQQQGFRVSGFQGFRATQQQGPRLQSLDM